MLPQRSISQGKRAGCRLVGVFGKLIAAMNSLSARTILQYTRIGRTGRTLLSLLPPRIDEQSHQTGITFGVHGCRIVWRKLRGNFVVR